MVCLCTCRCTHIYVHAHVAACLCTCTCMFTSLYMYRSWHLAFLSHVLVASLSCKLIKFIRSVVNVYIVCWYRWCLCASSVYVLCDMHCLSRQRLLVRSFIGYCVASNLIVCDSLLRSWKKITNHSVLLHVILYLLHEDNKTLDSIAVSFSNSNAIYNSRGVGSLCGCAQSNIWKLVVRELLMAVHGLRVDLSIVSFSIISHPPILDQQNTVYWPCMTTVVVWIVYETALCFIFLSTCTSIANVSAFKGVESHWLGNGNLLSCSIHFVIWNNEKLRLSPLFDH